jgi:hypothetical protein
MSRQDGFPEGQPQRSKWLKFNKTIGLLENAHEFKRFGVQTKYVKSGFLT